jgi:hypothetical protein
MTNLNIRALRASLFGGLVMAALLFLPAGTLKYWQAWVFLSVFVGASSAITVYLAIKDPVLLERRLKVGPKAETEQTQKFAVTLAIADSWRCWWSQRSTIVSDGHTCRPGSLLPETH